MEKKANNSKKYYLGLDIGTSSVGFAVTDENYNLIRKSGKHLWGSRLFEEANDASGRRAHRSARRRYQRRRRRINLLRQLFNDEIQKVDPDFFKRLDYSAYHNEDRPDNLRASYFLFGTHAKDKGFRKDNPTIYHLRKTLMESEEKMDIRLIYLAFAHMIKYRGNFLREGEIGQGDEDAQALWQSFDELNEAIKDIEEFKKESLNDFPSFQIDLEKAKKLTNFFKENLRKGELLDKEKATLGVDDLTLITILQMINGSDVKIEKLFKSLIDENPDLKEIKMSFEQDDYESTISSSGLPDEYINLLLKIKVIHDTRLLASLLQGKRTVSEAMVEIYETHKKQLEQLKELYQELAKDKYNAFFNEVPTTEDKKKKDVNYAMYVGLILAKDRIYRISRKDADINKLYARIRKDLDIEKRLSEEDNTTSEENKKKLREIQDAMERGTFLRIQNSKSNGVLPYQLNKNEMKTIIEKQGKYYPFLKEKAKSFLNPDKLEYKAVSMLEYKIPYYVGPLASSGDNAPNHWMVRKDSNGEITPWNFYDKVDKGATAQAFISRMKNNCSYLYGEDTLPRFSLIYLQYLIFNELNNVCINDEPLSIPEKNYLCEKVYKSNKKITPSLIKDELSNFHPGRKINLRTRKSDDEEKLGDVLKTAYSSYIDFASEKGFGKDFDRDHVLFEKAEKIIRLITLFEEKSILKDELRSNSFGLSEDQIQYFSSLKYKGWGRLSRKLLTNQGERKDYPIDILSKPVHEEPDITSPKERTILDLLKFTSQNFESIYHNPEYGFEEKVDSFNREARGENIGISELIEESYTSPGMKRALRQTFYIIDELKRILGISDFARIFVECTREKDKDPKKKSSRKKKLEALYKAAEEFAKQEKDETEKRKHLNLVAELSEKLKEKSDNELRAKKIFYYFAQLGHDVYTGEEIDLQDLSKEYDIDHIIPQALFKDDSFLNTVLVSKSVNNDKKSDTYPFGDDERILTPKGKEWIRFLNRIHKNDFMSDEKMNRILRTKELTSGELEVFVNRQIVTTNQTVKAVCDLLKETSKSDVIYSRAANVSEFRNVFGLIKLRALNNFHHANDAYLNIIVGNVYHEKFCNIYTKDWIEKHKESDPDFRCYTDVKSVFTGSDYIQSRAGDGTLVWTRTLTDEEKSKKYSERDPMKMGGTIDLVRKTLSWNDPMVTHMLHVQKNKQGLFNMIGLNKGANNTIEPRNDRQDGDGKKRKTKILCATFPLKNFAPFNSPNWEKKYGGYSNLTNCYFYLVQSGGNEKPIYSVEAMPAVFVMRNPRPNKDEIERWLRENTKLKEPHLVFDEDSKILIQSIFEIPVSDKKEDFDKKKTSKNQPKNIIKLGLSGKSGNYLIMINLNELHLTYEWQLYFKSISKLLGLGLPADKKKDLTAYEDSDKKEIAFGSSTISTEKNIAFYDYLCNEPYSRLEFEQFPGSQASRFKDPVARDNFINLKVIDQAKIIATMIELLSCKSVTGKDISLLGTLSDGKTKCPSDVGKIRVLKELLKGTRIVSESITGFYRKVIFEVK